MLNSYRAELLKIVKRPAAWVVAAVWLTLLLAFTELFPFVAYRSATSPRLASNLLSPLLPANLPGHAISGYPVWGGALILVLGALCWGSEYGWGTLKTMLTNRPGRFTFYIGQVTAMATTIAALVVVALGLCSAASVLIASSAGVAIDLPSPAAWAQSMAAGWLILLMWSLMGACLAIALRGTALSIGLGLIWILVIENLIRFLAPLIGAFADAQKFMPGVDAGSLVSAVGAASSTATGVAAVVSGPQAVWSIVLYLLIFGGVGAAIVLWRDVQ